jgi:hypothetical protein
MANELNGWCRARPIRVAFLIENGENAQEALDAIFANCYSRWGGRFSLIAPCIDRRISQRYWPWLEAFDPDVVYSYVPLNRVDVLEIHERLYPSKYIYHGLRRPTEAPPDLGLSALSSMSTIFRLARYRPSVGALPYIKIIDSWHSERPSRFLRDNFGTYHDCHGGYYPRDAVEAASVLTIVSPDHQSNPQLAVPSTLAVIPSETHAFREFACQRSTSLSILSALFAPRVEIASSKWSNSFNLVVGETFEDRVMLWNARLLVPSWLDRDLCCFRVDINQLQDTDFVSTLGLKRRNHINFGSGGPPRLMVRSVSHDSGELSLATDLIKSTGAWGWVGTEVVANLDALVPSTEEFHQARESRLSLGEPFPIRGWVNFGWSPPSAQPPAVVPDHLEDAPARHTFTGGFWPLDFGYQYDGPGRYPGGDNSWILSRRWRMAGAFQISWSDDKDSPSPLARRNRQGNLTIFARAPQSIASIRIPTAQDAFQYALAADGMWAKPDGEHDECQPQRKTFWIEPSNEARYLTGVLGMAGNLQRASQFLLHPFLREVFAEVGGAPKLSLDLVQPTLNRIERLAQHHKVFDLRTDREKEALAELVVKAAQSLKSPTSSIRYEDLKKRWSQHRERFWAARPEQERGEPRAHWDQMEEASLDMCLVELRRGQMFFQGHQWTCKKCHHKNWLDLGSVGTELSCEICRTTTQTPVNIGWLFRLNEFLIESLRDHSVLSLLWLLAGLRLRVNRSLVFVGPTIFGFNANTSKSDAEVDLLALVDGQAMLCEVKSSWRSLRSVHIQDFVALAKRLRPDKGLLAVMEPGTPPPELAEAESELAAEHIGFELLTPKDFHVPDDSFLPSTSEA